MSKAARFITIEGIEGVGKSTQMTFVEAYLKKYGVSILKTREPGGTPLAEEIRGLVLSEREEKVNPDTELLLMFASRAQHLDEVILPALNRGEWVLSDRFIDATYAYQGGGRHIPVQRMDILTNWTLKGLMPDLTLLLDAPVDIALARAKSRNTGTDRFEEEKQHFFTEVRAAYLERAKAEPQRIRVIDASQSLEAVQIDIQKILQELI